MPRARGRPSRVSGATILWSVTSNYFCTERPVALYAASFSGRIARTAILLPLKGGHSARPLENAEIGHEGVVLHRRLPRSCLARAYSRKTRVSWTASPSLCRDFLLADDSGSVSSSGFRMSGDDEERFVDNDDDDDDDDDDEAELAIAARCIVPSRD